MGFKLFDDKIAVASHNSGVITLPASILTIAGQQYSTASLSRTISTDVTMVANTLYFVYAQVISGVVALRISASAPSVYLVSNPLSKLVAAFYSNGLASVAFGSFVNITGSPESQWIDDTPTWTASGTAPAIGNGSLIGKWRRVGDTANREAILTLGSTSTTGTGVQYISLIANNLIDSTKLASTNFNNGICALYDSVSAANHRVSNPQFEAGANNRVSMYLNATGNFVNTTTGWGGSGDQFNCSLYYPVLNWSNTQLIDL